MARWILGLTFWACFLGLTSGQPCRRSSDCAASQCCRSAQTNNTLVDNPQGPFETIIGEGDGQCVEGGAKPGDMCDYHCQCPSGYECYRKITGVCCAPRTCITIAEANADRDYWRCQPPPPAPPPGGNGNGGDVDGDGGQVQNSFKSARLTTTTTTTTTTTVPPGEGSSKMMKSFKSEPRPPPSASTTEAPEATKSFKKVGPGGKGRGGGRRTTTPPPSEGERSRGRPRLFRSLCPSLPMGAVPGQAAGAVLP